MIVTKITYGETYQPRPYESDRFELEIIPADGQTYEQAAAEVRAFVRHQLRGEPLPSAVVPVKTPPAVEPATVATASGVTTAEPDRPLTLLPRETILPPETAPSDGETVQRLPKGYGKYTADQWIEWLAANKANLAKLDKALAAAVDNRPNCPDTWERCVRAFADRVREYSEGDWPQSLVDQMKAERKWIDEKRAQVQSAAA